MINIDNWPQRRQRYEQYWTKTNKTPLVYVSAPSDHPVSMEVGTASDPWYDFSYNCRAARAYFCNTYFGLDAYPYYLPDLGFDVATSMLGVKIKINKTSAWAVPMHKKLSEITDFSFKPDNPDYLLQTRALDIYVNDAHHPGVQGDVDYIVGMVPFNTCYDGVASLIGSAELCLEMYDHPEDVHRVANGHFELFKQVYSIFEKQTLQYQHGSTNWLGVYSDVPWYYISDDFIVMVSEEFFDEFIMETLRKSVEFHPRTLYHLDGENVVRHLDKILTLDKLTGVQVQATPAAQSAEFWTPYLQKIQSRGKTCWIEARHMDDLKYLTQHLEPEGLFIKTWADTEAEAHDMERYLRDYYGTTGY